VLGLQRLVCGKGGLAPWRKTVWYWKKRHRHGACPPFPHAGGPSQKGTGTVAGNRICREAIIEATEPVPFCDCRPGAVVLARYAIILAGGTDTRLWPMSRADLPKQLIPFISPNICAYPPYLSETTYPSLIGPVPFSVPSHCEVWPGNQAARVAGQLPVAVSLRHGSCGRRHVSSCDNGDSPAGGRSG